MKTINRTNDYAFMRIFGSEEGKEALISFRKLNPKYLLDKAARLDILAKTASGALVNVEVQIVNKYNIDKRTVFYWAGLYHGQLASGQNFIYLRKTHHKHSWL